MFFLECKCFFALREKSGGSARKTPPTAVGGAVFRFASAGIPRDRAFAASEDATAQFPVSVVGASTLPRNSSSVMPRLWISAAARRPTKR